MKIKVLGTAAYERVPAMFCSCPICNYAREHGSKEVRTQAQVLINDDLLVDFGQDSFYHSLRFGVDFQQIKNILITHSHSDHFIPEDFLMTKAPYGHNDIELNVYGGQSSYEAFLPHSQKTKAEFTVVSAYQTFEVGKYTVTALPARHGTKTPFIYIINDGEKTILYGNDSGIEYDEVYEFIKNGKYSFDLVISDCTNGNLHFEKINSHKSFKDNIFHKQKLTENGNVTDKTIWVITHFSHNGLLDNNQPLSHENVSAIAEKMGMVAAYDGITFEI